MVFLLWYRENHYDSYSIFMKTNKDHNRMDGNTSVSVSTRWANRGRRVPLLRNKDILLHFDSQYVIFTCICVYKRNQKYFIYIYKGTTPSWILFGRYSLFFAWSIIFFKVIAVEPHSKLKDIRIIILFL